MIDKIIEELVELIHGSQDAFGDGYNTAITNSINIVEKYRNDGWIDTDFAIPSFDRQMVKIMISDLIEDYEYIGHYNHDKNEWVDIDGNITDEVYKWKPYKGE